MRRGAFPMRRVALPRFAFLTRSDSAIVNQGHHFRNRPISVMLKRTVLRRIPTLAMVLVAGLSCPSREAQAQHAQPGSITTYRITRGPIFGRHSPSLSQVWGAPKMPATPRDFGPHFDFPAGGSQTLSCGSPGSTYYCGGVSDAPYAN